MTSLPSPLRRAALGGTSMLLVLMLATGAQALSSEREELQEQRERNAQQREQLESELEGTDEDLAAAYLALQDANDRLPAAEADLAQAEEDLAAAERTQAALADRLDVAESQLETLTAEITSGDDQIESARSSIGELARTTYRGGASLSGLQVVFNATSSEEFVSQYARVDTAVRSQTQVISDLEDITAVNRNRLARQDAVIERVDELNEAAEEALDAAAQARAAAERYAQEIRDIRDTQAALAEQLEDAREQLEASISEKEAENEEMSQRIREILEEEERIERERQEREERERASREAEEQRSRDAASSQTDSGSSGSSGSGSSGSGSSGSGSSGSGSSGGSSGSSNASGSLVPPVPAPVYVTSPYGYRVHPIAGYRWMHDGVDLRSTCGEAQTASASGTVASVRPAAGNASHGNQVFINHGRINGSTYITVYNHLSRFNVSQGQQVSQGDIIGYTGATGNVTGCHVHFEVWKDGSTIDPMNLPAFTRRYS